MEERMPPVVWGDFWTPPVEDDVPIPEGVELDPDTERYRHVLDKTAREAWLEREMSDIRAWMRAAGE